MRTTLDLDPVVLNAARQFAAHRAVSLGRAVSELVLRGLNQPDGPGKDAAGDGDDALPTFYSSPGSPVITLEDVKRLLDDEA
ncbi:hypothetical protein [Xylophilus sp.]|uniref:hypothetical protein n=1 Tax=Xylophilus sp. TaxID=2653893 RepID=UPI0013B60C6F|nr:hypothetical protein [Xylophilus sp.]KAF1046738.1 MAG: putative antitoxin VapB38 [Xylophilus sp.]